MSNEYLKIIKLNWILFMPKWVYLHSNCRSNAEKVDKKIGPKIIFANHWNLLFNLDKISQNVFIVLLCDSYLWRNVSKYTDFFLIIVLTSNLRNEMKFCMKISKVHNLNFIVMKFHDKYLISHWVVISIFARDELISRYDKKMTFSMLVERALKAYFNLATHLNICTWKQFIDKIR